jgi:hypothetical protein
MELATAVKPFLLEHLLERGARRLLYLDPDIWVLHSLQPLFDRLEKCSVLLTPHMTSRLDDDGAEPNEFTLLRSGAYNLGFVGVRDTPEARELLEWWKQGCADFCVAEGFAATIPWPYSYQRFDNGVRIVPLLRHILQRLGRDADVFGDPFAVAGPSSFYEWLFAPAAGESPRAPCPASIPPIPTKGCLARLPRSARRLCTPGGAQRQ